MKQLEQVSNEPGYDRGNAVLNGIAYYPPQDAFIISGKLWDSVHLAKLDYLKFMQ